jgi:hypothetical protein
MKKNFKKKNTIKNQLFFVQSTSSAAGPALFD